LGTTFICCRSPLYCMFVRVKNIRERRYAYLVVGVREGGRVKQKTICYLGSLSKLASSGVSEDIMSRAAERFQVDWKAVNDEIRQIPLTFDELSEARRRQFAISIGTRRQGIRTQGNLSRADGELSALSRLAATRFKDMFEETGELSYRMK